MTTDMTAGHSDEPSNTDLLGVGPYVEGLASFIETCQTPLTVAVQGGWGTGKTTVLGLTSTTLEKRGSDAVTTMFDAWQVAFSDRSEDVIVALVSQLVDVLEQQTPAANAPVAAMAAMRLRHHLARCWHVVAAGGLRLAGAAAGPDWVPAADAAASVVSQVGEAYARNAEQAPAPEARPVTGATIREDFRALVAESLGDDPDERRRLVVFIDNLDRLDPARSLEIMECIKAVLDSPHCVFVVAIDFDVVVEGVKLKYKKMPKQKAQAFFDKIIQLPFHVPLSQYDTTRMLQLLCQDFDADGTLPAVRAIVQAAVGANPRSVKRMLNAYRLITAIHDAKSEDSTSPGAESRLRLLAQVGLQVGYPEVYRHFDQPGLDQLIDALSAAAAALQPVEGDDAGDEAAFHSARAALRDWAAEQKAAAATPGDAAAGLPDSFGGAVPLLAVMADQYREDDGGIDSGSLEATWNLSGVTASAPSPVAAEPEDADAPAPARRAKSTRVIYDHDLIEPGAHVTFDVDKLVKPDVVAKVDAWLDADPVRRDVTWVDDPVRPLRWALEAGPNETWTPSALRNRIFELAGDFPHPFSAADAWRYKGCSLYWVADLFLHHGERVRDRPAE